MIALGALVEHLKTHLFAAVVEIAIRDWLAEVCFVQIHPFVDLARQITPNWYSPAVVVVVGDSGIDSAVGLHRSLPGGLLHRPRSRLRHLPSRLRLVRFAFR